MLPDILTILPPEHVGDTPTKQIWGRIHSVGRDADVGRNLIHQDAAEQVFTTAQVSTKARLVPGERIQDGDNVWTILSTAPSDNRWGGVNTVNIQREVEWLPRDEIL